MMATTAHDSRFISLQNCFTKNVVQMCLTKKFEQEKRVLF